MVNCKYRRSFKLAFKERIINEYKKHKSISFLSKKYKIDRKQVRTWIKKSKKIREAKFKRTTA
jgi:transposase-like protein